MAVGCLKMPAEKLLFLKLPTAILKDSTAILRVSCWHFPNPIDPHLQILYSAGFSRKLIPVGNDG